MVLRLLIIHQLQLAFIPLVQCQSTMSPAWYCFINGLYLLWVPYSIEDKVEVETLLMGEHRHKATSLLISTEIDAYISSISSTSATLHRGTKSWRWAERPAVTSFRDRATQLGLKCFSGIAQMDANMQKFQNGTLFEYYVHFNNIKEMTFYLKS